MGTINDTSRTYRGTYRRRGYATIKTLRFLLKTCDVEPAEEPLAIKSFEKQKGITVDSVGFCVSV